MLSGFWIHERTFVLVQHDGFVSQSRLNVAEVSEAIFTATGYRLELEEKLLDVDAYRYFASRMR